MVYGNMISDLLLEGFKVDNQQVFHLPQKKEQKKKVSDVLISWEELADDVFDW